MGYVECATYEECRDYLQKHPELINKDVSDEMFQKVCEMQRFYACIYTSHRDF